MEESSTNKPNEETRGAIEEVGSNPSVMFLIIGNIWKHLKQIKKVWEANKHAASQYFYKSC